MAESKRIHRFNINFAESTYEALEELAERKGKSKAEILRDAIALTKYIDDTRMEGGHVLVEHKGRETREIVIP